MIKALIRQILHSFGYEIVRSAANLTREELSVMQKVKGLTGSGSGRLVGVMDAVKYLVNNQTPGAVVECGVWRGGSVMAAALTLLQLGDTTRDIYLFDTFEGMTAPTERDLVFDGSSAKDLLAKDERNEGSGIWCVASLEDVRCNVFSTGYPKDKIHFIKGRVEDTLPAKAPQSIALLRLDTDWYESTQHELMHLYPRLSSHGVLIIDDYGHWQGARQAVDEYFAKQKLRPFLNRLDYTGRLMIKSDN